MPNDDEIKFTGKPSDYKPTVGHARPPANANTGKPVTGYHNIDNLRKDLERIRTETTELLGLVTNKLGSYNLKVETDTTLADAQASEWPTDDLGDPKDYVSFHQYLSLEKHPTRGSDYIRKNYESAIRGPSGANLIDIFQIVTIIKSEAENIIDFLDTYIGDIDDSSEYRTLELFQDWCKDALKNTRNFRSCYQENITPSPQIPTAELAKVSPEEATQFQALFQVKINTLNRQIETLQEDLRKDYAEHSQVYYKRFLGPALSYRLKTGKFLDNRGGNQSFLDTQAASASDALNQNFQNVLADQLKRNIMFKQKTSALDARVKVRDTYVNYTKQLAPHGKAIKNKFVDLIVPSEEVERFSNVADGYVPATPNLATNRFRSDHDRLSGRDDPASHPWAINKAGDTLTGKFEFDLDPDDADLEFPFDGMRPGGPTGHRHEGPDVDGTRKIRGYDLEPGTLPTGQIDTDESVCRPVNLRLMNMDFKVVPPGVTSVSAKIAWETCDASLTYDFEIVAIPDDTTPIGTVDPVVTEWVVEDVRELG